MITTLDGRQFIRSLCVAAATGTPAVRRLGAETDTGHMIACGFDPTAAYEKLRSHIRIIHLKDEDKPGHGVGMGKGSGNTANFVRMIANDRFNGLAAIEFEEGTDPKVGGIGVHVLHPRPSLPMKNSME
jgi:sugar phosphate isomerase/epimerase